MTREAGGAGWRDMSWLDNLEHRLRPFAVPHVTLGLIMGQVYVFLMALVKPEFVGAFELVPERVLAGEAWRPFTFFLIPPIGNPICMIFGWYLFYLMGTALENYWGTFRYNLFIFVGWVATVAASFVTPEQPTSNAFLMGSVFLAFAFLNPDFELYILFLLPLKIRWLAVLTWCTYGYLLVTGTWTTRLAVLASVSNFLLFFGSELFFRVKGARRRMALQAQRFATPEREYFHRCAVCGITDRTHPKMEFRYCSKCAGAHGYCTEHLRNHEHVTAPEEAGRGL